MASLLGKKGYKAIRVINSEEKITVSSRFSSFNSFHCIFFFMFVYGLESLSFHLLKICVSFLSFTSLSIVAGFPRLTT